MRVLVTVVAAVSLLACGESSSTPESSSGGAAGAEQSGCSTAPHCGSCVSCFETCICQGKDNDACIAECATSTGGTGGTGAMGGSGGSVAGAGGLGGAAGSAGGSAAAGGAAGGPVTETVTIKTAPRTLKPGEEAFFCQNFSNPFGKDVDVIRSESLMTPGSHHMFVFYSDGAKDGPVHDCSGLEYDKTLHSAQTPQHLTTYPAGVGRVVKKSTGLRVLAHYLNTSNKPVDAVINVVFNVAPAGTVQHEAGALFFLNPAIYVPPYQTGKASDTCSIPKEIHIIDIVSHMHQYSTNFDSKLNGNTTVYQTTDWDEPKPTVFNPPLKVTAGSTISYTCEYKNTLPQALTFGDSAVGNEMCILSGTYYPAPGGAILGCN